MIEGEAQNLRKVGELVTESFRDSNRNEYHTGYLLKLLAMLAVLWTLHTYP